MSAELGRYPIEVKATQLSILYWLRLEKGSKNMLLNCAYAECKINNHAWLYNIHDSLCSNGLKYVWDQGSVLSKGYVKAVVKQRLEDQYIQKFSNYINESNCENNTQTNISQICNMNERYQCRKYLDLIR